MDADELGIALTELDKEFNAFVKVFQAKRTVLKQMYGATAKYRVGYKFQHSLHGEMTVVGIYVWEGKKKGLMIHQVFPCMMTLIILNLFMNPFMSTNAD